MDPFWAMVFGGVFAGHFPGIESLSGSVNPQKLEQFGQLPFYALPNAPQIYILSWVSDGL
ncbi:hypothetical protein BGW80DRAFT_1297720 [Lactifluus volemus]|nr:hypothetical protein BGW80DRAFT_1297720 [Lactifluus volemus]